MSQQAEFERLVTPHLEAAYNLALWLVRHEADAEDVMQEACLKAFRSFHGFRGGEMRPWLLTVVRHAAFDRLRQRRAGQNFISIEVAFAAHDSEPAGANLPSSTPTPEDALASQDTSSMVRQALANINPIYREVLVLREMQGLSYVEIGKIVGVPKGTIMSRLSRARAELRRQLEPLWTEVSTCPVKPRES